jgi:hypothetical protein
MEGIWNQIAVAVAPTMEWIGNTLAEVAGRVARIIDAWNDFFGSQPVDTANKAKDKVDANLAAMERELKARDELEKKGVSLTESMRDPMEIYNDSLADLNAMLEAGVISWDTYGRAVAKAQDDIKKSEKFKAKEIKVAERAAVGVTLRGHGASSMQQKQIRALEKIRAEEKLQLKQLQQQTTLLQQLNNNIKTGTVVTI